MSQEDITFKNWTEKEFFENLLYKHSGNLTEATKACDINRATLYRKVKQFNINPLAIRKQRKADDERPTKLLRF